MFVYPKNRIRIFTKIPSLRGNLSFYATVVVSALILAILPLLLLTNWSLIFIGISWTFLGVLTWLGYKTSLDIGRLEREIQAEREQCREWAEGQGVAGIVDGIKQQRRQLLANPELVPYEPLLQAPELCSSMLRELQDAYITGDALDVGRLDADLQHQAAARHGPVAERQAWAFMIGFLGTLTGILFQFFIAQETGIDVLFTDEFLGGAILAVTTTVQGVVTALYIHYRVSRLGTEFDRVIASVRTVFRRVFVPRLGGANQSELERFADRIAEQLSELLGGFLGALKGDLDTFLRELPAQIDNTISRLLEESVSVRIEEAMRVFAESMGLIKGSIKEAEKALQRGVGALERQIDRLILHPDETSKRLDDTLVQATRIAGVFETVADKVSGMVVALERVVDQLASLPPSPAVSAAHPQVSRDIDQLLQNLVRQQELMGNAIGQLGKLADGMGNLDDRINEQRDKILSNMKNLMLQQNTITQNNQGIVAKFKSIQQGITQTSEGLDKLGNEVAVIRHQVRSPRKAGMFSWPFGGNKRTKGA
uniref:MotA/TolQ/ExbB proton channel domain-containing protein n=1 Tax=Candidatus Kentrum sp. DK TaxID=2126562 RepID=A0A450T1P4_9GAMM|nr:MAG: hypothetical protein BECKDK2373C_GA0170839_10813 [Candidatus Kentron sp. DK]